jgi:hypothetical protein
MNLRRAVARLCLAGTESPRNQRKGIARIAYQKKPCIEPLTIVRLVRGEQRTARKDRSGWRLQRSFKRSRVGRKDQRIRPCTLNARYAKNLILGLRRSPLCRSNQFCNLTNSRQRRSSILLKQLS